MKKLTLTLLALLIAVPAFAIDYWGGPPEDSWDRGEAGSTFEHWNFSEPVPFGPPEIFDNPFGDPTFELLDTDFEYGQWECPLEMNPDGFITGWHCINPDGGTIILMIPNTDAIDGDKTIFLQITSSKGLTDVTAEGFGNSPNGYTTTHWPTGLPHIQWGTPAPFGGVWYTYNYGFVIRPNPQFEIITITVPFCTVIDQIVVDTICSGTVATEESTLDQVKALYR